MRPWRRRISADIGQDPGWAKPPAPASPPVPGITPGAGAPSPGSAVTPRAASPGTGPRRRRRTLMVIFYDDGGSDIYDYRRRRWTAISGDEPYIDLSDDALERFIRGQG